MFNYQHTNQLDMAMAVSRVNEVELRALQAELELAQERVKLFMIRQEKAEAELAVKRAELRVVKDELNLLREKVTAQEDDTVYAEDE